MGEKVADSFKWEVERCDKLVQVFSFHRGEWGLLRELMTDINLWYDNWGNSGQNMSISAYNKSFWEDIYKPNNWDELIAMNCRRVNV